MLELTVNGKNQTLEGECMLSDGLVELGFEGSFFAVAVNGNFVPRSQYAVFSLKGGETLEVLSPMQGG